MILITGATGHLGTAVIRGLLQKMPASQIAALVRDAQKAAPLSEQGIDVRIGDYDDKASLDAAMQGVDKVLLISGGSAPNGLEQHQNVVDSAKKAGVACMAYTGRALKDRETLTNKLMLRHFETDDYVMNSGMNYVLFRNILYMDTIPTYLGQQVADTGVNLPAGNGKVSFALRSEMGEAIANVLAGNDCNKRILNFTGLEAYSYYDVADALSELMGKQVSYTALKPEDYIQQMKERGMPEHMIPYMTGFMTDIANGQEDTISNDLADALGRRPASLKEGLKTLYNL